MIKAKWHTVTYLAYVAYCIAFFIVFWTVFTNDDIFNRYFYAALGGLQILCSTNTAVQLIALAMRKKHAVSWLLTGLLLLFLTIGFTFGQGV